MCELSSPERAPASGGRRARLIAQRGDRVALIARGHVGLDGAVRDVQREGGVALAFSAESADRPDNLWEPVDDPHGDDHGAHGEFDYRSHSRSARLPVSHHPVAAMAAGVTAAAVGRGRREPVPPPVTRETGTGARHRCVSHRSIQASSSSVSTGFVT